MKLNRSVLSSLLLFFFFTASGVIDGNATGMNRKPLKKEVKKGIKTKNVKSSKRETILLNGDKNKSKTVSPREYDESRTFTKEFDVKGSESLKVVNEFGKIHFETWDQAKVSFEIELKIKNPNEKKAKSLADEFKPKFSQSSGKLISCEIDLPDMKRQGDEQYMEADIIVKMPKTINLEAKNSFGDIYLPDFDGDLDLRLSYGQLKAGNLNGSKNELDISFGGGTWGDFKEADVKISYSEFEMGSGNKLDLNSQFSQGEIGSFGKLNAKVNYGELEAKNIGDLQGDFQFSSVEVDRIEKTALFKAFYGDGMEIGMISKSFTKVDVTAQFAGVEMNFEEGASFLMEAEMDFGELDYKEADFKKMNVDKREYVPSATYKGIFGSGDNPSSKVNIRGEYSDIEIN